jgi:thymidylate kinase
MRFTNIRLEGPDCSGKTTLFNNIHKATNYKYNIQDRSCLSMYVFACMYDRDQSFWYDKFLEDLKKLDTLYVLLMPPKEELVKRIKKRGDNIQDENTIVDVWNSFNNEVVLHFGKDIPNLMIINPKDKMENVKKVLERMDSLNLEKGSKLIKNLVIEMKSNELTNVSCVSYIDKDKLEYSVMDFKEESEYYQMIMNHFLEKISKELLGLNEYKKPQDELSRRFIYTHDSCISMIHMLFRENKIDFNVIMRSSNVLKTLWADYEFLKILAFESAKELKFKNVPIKMTLNIRSAHLIP